MGLIDRLKRRRDRLQGQLDQWIAHDFRGGRSSKALGHMVHHTDLDRVSGAIERIGSRASIIP